ncbi:MAG: single-stranded DNA-binding protein [Patescibacteria group bacterium]|jgi:single-strand DNA-binding protein
MSARSLNKVTLIGNLTRDPELRYTPQGTAVAQFGLATNRDWVTSGGEKKEDVQYHRIVAWSKLAELCSQLLSKGSKVYVEGRIVYRNFEGKDGTQKNVTEIVVDNMIFLGGGKNAPGRAQDDSEEKKDESVNMSEMAAHEEKKSVKKPTKAGNDEESAGNTPDGGGNDRINDEDIPF